jgi:hypothetical protein
MILDKMNNEPIIVTCPSCKEFIIIEQINCAIFRHGVLKNNYSQIGPHSSKEECDSFVNNDLIFGCGKPFKLEKQEELIDDKINIKYTAITCDYI